MMPRSCAMLLVLLAACSDTADPDPQPDPGTPAAAASVTVGDNFYSPSTATIAVNGTVTWTWGGGNPHTVTFDNAPVTSAGARTSGTVSRQFATAGEYTYFCQIHGQAMSGKVVVVAP